MLRNLPPLTRFLIIAYIAALVLGLFARGPYFQFAVLYGVAVFPGLEFWRIATYPFVLGIGSALGAGLMAYFFGSELEQIVHSQKLGIALAIAVLAGGLLIAFISPTSIIAGPDVITFFILGGFVYLWPKREISIFGMFSVKAWIIALIYFAISILPSTGTRLDASASKLFGPIYGAAAALVFFHLAYRQYAIPGLSGMRPASKASTKDSWSETQSVQRRIDAILDKISRSGMESLTKEERDFLSRNSQR